MNNSRDTVYLQQPYPSSKHEKTPPGTIYPLARTLLAPRFFDSRDFSVTTLFELCVNKPSGDFSRYYNVLHLIEVITKSAR